MEQIEHDIKVGKFEPVSVSEINVDPLDRYHLNENNMEVWNIWDDLVVLKGLVT